MKKWLSLVVGVCIIGGVVTVGFAQEFPEDELVEEAIVVVTFPTGKFNPGKLRQIYRHTEKVQIGWEPPKPKYGERQSLYTYMPHPVVTVNKPKVEYETEYRVLPPVSVTVSSPRSSPKSHKSHKSHSRRSRR
jgi:hypothetical protein